MRAIKISNMIPFIKSHTFKHGVHPPEYKHLTNQLPIERVPFFNEYILPVQQHIGAPAIALVRPGDKVKRGQMLAKAGGFVSTAMHSPVTGTVKAVELRPHVSGKLTESIVIEADPYNNQKLEVEKPVRLELSKAEEIVQLIQNAGIVGMGGAAFPSHVKLKIPEGKKASCVILNGCECEPYLTCDHKLMTGHTDEILRGLELTMGFLGASYAVIGIEKNKPDAIAAMEKRVKKYQNMEVIALEVKYPQGAEKMLIDAVLKKQVPTGKLPVDIEVVVQNVATTRAIGLAIDKAEPLIERVVTVTGFGVERPGNYWVPIGTRFVDLLEYCGGLKDATKQVIVGGPMMGNSQKNLDASVTKGTSGILVLAESPPGNDLELACIRCGRCVEACPMFLNPSRLATLIRAEKTELLQSNNLPSCFECASCSYACPSNIPLVQLMRMGKGMMANLQKYHKS